MKVTYLKRPTSRVGHKCLVRDIMEGDIIRHKWPGCRWAYYKKEGRYFYIANRRRHPIWRSYYNTRDVEDYTHILNMEGEIISSENIL